ncbi:hypothetical protein Patl1_20111 [Pistacia atlantica]|uniref:Uncharacterized protein n=1 Tax=Pistacia atlantica TaxID=434234 RepID=A0ACC1BJX4_9ROSI|nr:hypothetical protein Patl1_20111 [Pistacia atlantica]
MVNLTIVGRVRDGLALAQGPRYINQANDNFSFYKQQAEFILKEISRGALAPSKMTIRVDHKSFHYLMENGICFITLSDSSYPRKLAFHYLQDLQKEFQKFDSDLVDKITRPYSFVKFGKVTLIIALQLMILDSPLKLQKEYWTSPEPESSIWGSPLLEDIALKWTPITIIIVGFAVLFWANLALKEDFII